MNHKNHPFAVVRRHQVCLVALAGMLLTACEPVLENKSLITREQTATLLPDRKQDKASWAADIHRVFNDLRIDTTVTNICTSVAIIDQESNFSADPSVPNLGRSSLTELESRLEDRLGKTLAGVFRQMLATRPTAENNFRKQILAVKTERELDELYRTMFAYFADNYKMGAINNAAKSFNQGIDERLNPITTLGSMQVHIDYAKENRRASMNDDALRNDLYSQYGGLYYGIHRLMLYPAKYDEPIYRFADYNSGMYSSRNAALQAQVAKLSGQSLVLDGDLLLYKGDNVRTERSKTEETIIALLPKLGTPEAPLNANQVRKDLRKEKTAEFESTATYQAIKALYEKTTGKSAPYAMMPKVAINSPKLNNTYDTNWFATNVQRRYDRCVAIARDKGYPMD